MKLIPILLPTKDKSPVLVGVKAQGYSPRMILTKDADAEWLKFGTYNNIYLTDETAEIEEGNYFYYPKSYKNIGLCNLKDYKYLSDKNNNNWLAEACFKIIASTDSSLNLPILSEQPIKLLIDYYNKNGKMPESVNVKEIQLGQIVDDNEWIPTRKSIKTNIDNTVDISIPEEKVDNINRLPIEAMQNLVGYINTPVGRRKYPAEIIENIQTLSKWIKQNL